MGRAELIGTACVVLWVGMTVGRLAAEESLDHMEKCWVQEKTKPSPEVWRAELRNMGAEVREVVGGCEVRFLGPAQAWTAVVNRLLRTGCSWKAWQTQVGTTGDVEGRVLL
jgi:hypothetical protein